MQRRPGAPSTSDVLGPGLTAGLGPRVPEGFNNFKEYRQSKDAAAAPSPDKREPWTWSQWMATLLVPIVVVSVIILLFPGGASPDPDATAALEWDGNLTEVGLEMEADGAIADLGSERALEREREAREASLKEEEAANAVVRADGSMNWDAYARSQAPPAPDAPLNPPVMDAFRTCDFFEKQSAAIYFNQFRCDFDVKKQVPNPVGGGTVELEYIALASYLEAFAYVQRQEAAEWNRKRKEANLKEQEEITDAVAMSAEAQEKAKSSRVDSIEFKEDALNTSVEEGGSSSPDAAAALAAEGEEQEQGRGEEAEAEAATATAMDEGEGEGETRGSPAAAKAKRWNPFGRHLLAKKGGRAAPAAPVRAVEIDPNGDPMDKPYKAIIVGGSQAYFGFLAGRAFKVWRERGTGAKGFFGGKFGKYSRHVHRVIYIHCFIL